MWASAIVGQQTKRLTVPMFGWHRGLNGARRPSQMGGPRGADGTPAGLGEGQSVSRGRACGQGSADDGQMAVYRLRHFEPGLGIDYRYTVGDRVTSANEKKPFAAPARQIPIFQTNTFVLRHNPFYRGGTIWERRG